MWAECGSGDVTGDAQRGERERDEIADSRAGRVVIEGVLATEGVEMGNWAMEGTIVSVCWFDDEERNEMRRNQWTYRQQKEIQRC